MWNDLTESELEPSLAASGQQREGGQGRELHLAELRELWLQWRPGPRRPQGGDGVRGGPQPPRDRGPHPELRERALWV